MNATSTNARPKQAAATPDRKIEYPFDPPPKRARELVEQGRISRTDYLVLVELLRYQLGFRGSCWTTKKKIADALNISTKTVQRSYRQLEAVDLIRLNAVSRPGSCDPDEPANRTGYRIHFLFVDAVRPIGPASDRRKPEDRREHASKPGGEDTNVLPPLHVSLEGGEDTNVLPGEDTNVLQFRMLFEHSDGTKKDDDRQTENACMSSSSFASLPSDQDQEIPPIIAELLRRTPEIDRPLASTHAMVASPASAIGTPEPPTELVNQAAAVMPDVSREWLRGFLAACGRHGLELALLVVAWVKVRSEHPETAKRPRNPRAFAMSALVGTKEIPGWRIKLDSRETTFDDIRAEIRASPQAKALASFDPAAWLAKVAAKGWMFRPDGKGGIEKYEKPNSGAADWSKGGLGSVLWEEMLAHTDAIKAHVLAQGKVVHGVPT